MLLILFLSFFFANTFAQIPFYKPPQFNHMNDFNKSAFSDTWYEISRISNLIEYNEICSAATFEYNKPLGTYNMVQNAISPRSNTLRNVFAAMFPIENGTSSFIFRFPIKPPVNLGVVTILDTDYENYTVTAGVISFRKFYLVFAWIGSRKPTLSPEYYDHINDVLRINKIPISSLAHVEQTCPNIVNA